MKAKELRQKRASLISQARAILDQAETAGRALTQEEDNQYNALVDQINKLAGEIEREERQAELEAEVAATQGTQTRTNGAVTNGQESHVAFESRYLRNLDIATTPEFRAIHQLATPEYHRAFREHLRTGSRRGLVQAEERALQADADIYGGFLYPSVQFVDRLIMDLDNEVFVRRFADVQQVANAESLGAPSLDNDPADPTWTSELAIGTEDSTMSFGGRELTPHPLAKYIKVSRKLMRKVPDIEALVRRRLGYKFAVTLEYAYLNGSGSGQPLGVFTASVLGISTSRDVSTGNTTTSITFDGLKEAKYSLKQGYWRGARWGFHRDAIKQIAKLKDGEGRYVWQDSIVEGEPDRLLGFPVDMSEYVPNTFTTGLYVGILANWSYYWIADALQMEMQRLDELYAATNQVGFIGRLESDGMPVLESAFARVKLATG